MGNTIRKILRDSIQVQKYIRTEIFPIYDGLHDEDTPPQVHIVLDGFYDPLQWKLENCLCIAKVGFAAATEDKDLEKAAGDSVLLVSSLQPFFIAMKSQPEKTLNAIFSVVKESESKITKLDMMYS